MKAVCEFRNVTKWFPPNHLLFSHMNLRVAHHEKILITGYAGSGRTSLVQLISGEMQADEGDVRTDSRPLIIPARFGWLESMTMQEHLALPYLAEGHGLRESLHMAADVIEGLGLSGRAHARPMQMTACEKAAAAFGQVMFREGTLIVADTFMTDLTEDERERLMAFIMRYRDERALLMLSDRPLMPEIFDRVINIEDIRLGDTAE